MIESKVIQIFITITIIELIDKLMPEWLDIMIVSIVPEVQAMFTLSAVSHIISTLPHVRHHHISLAIQTCKLHTHPSILSLHKRIFRAVENSIRRKPVISQLKSLCFRIPPHHSCDITDHYIIILYIRGRIRGSVYLLAAEIYRPHMNAFCIVRRR